MAAATWIKNLLEKRGVPFEEHQHRQAFTAQELAQSEHISGNRVAKVVVVLADGQPVELVLPASRRVDLERVKQTLNAQDVRLASEAEMDRIFSDVETGAIPALRHWKDVKVVMDESMEVKGDILLQGGTHEDSILLNYEDWFRLVQPRVASFTLEPAGT